MYLILLFFLALVIGISLFMKLPRFGNQAKGERLSRVEASPQYHNKRFHNQEITPQITSDKSRIRTMFDFIFEKRKGNRPKSAIQAIKTDLKALPKTEDLLLWFGHSSYFVQNAGKRFLVDPVFEAAAPVNFLNKAFNGSDIYKAEDMPDMDYILITHDHWDHLDCETLQKMKSRVNKIICPLGVGAHLEHWGFSKDQIVELDWYEKTIFNDGFTIHLLPSHHFSGRGLESNQTLWGGFMIESSAQNIYISGDGGYGKHFVEIAKRFPNIDIAIMENGQYSTDWRYIHLIPEDLKKALQDLNPKKILLGHNSKYALAKHSWQEPHQTGISLKKEGFPILTPLIGEVVKISDSIIF